MPKAEWGTKRLCPTTGKRFYDLNKNPIVSPYTGEIVDIESVRRKITSVAATRPAPVKDNEAVVEDLETDDDDLLETAETEDDDLDDDLLEDDDEDDTVSLDDLADVAGGEDES